MKKPALVAALVATLAIGAFVTPIAHASTYGGGPSVAVSVSYFYDSLAPYGSWVDYSPYGWCWSPAGVGSGWRPYSDGYWAYTDYGWTWVDYASWGWAPYHYGRWVYDPFYGWLWAPGTVWAPAWVAWSYEDDWVGWAPLPPVVGWQTSVFVSFNRYASIPASHWCFVPTRRLFDRHLRTSIAPISRNAGLLEHSRNATRYAVRGGQPFNQGIDVRKIERATGNRVPRMHIADASSPSRGRGQSVGRGALSFYRPTMTRPHGAAPRPETRMPRRHESDLRGPARLARNEDRDLRGPRTLRDDGRAPRDETRREIAPRPDVESRRGFDDSHSQEVRRTPPAGPEPRGRDYGTPSRRAPDREARERRSRPNASDESREAPPRESRDHGRGRNHD